MLCCRCKEFCAQANKTCPPKGQITYFDFILHPDIQALEASSRYGCHLCRLIFYHLIEWPSKQFDSKICAGRIYLGLRVPRSLLSFNLQEDGLYAGFEALSRNIEGPPEGLYITIDLEMKSRPFLDQLQRLDLQLDTSTSSAISLGFCKFWIRNCMKNHTSCAKIATSTRLPTRVIAVGCGEDMRAPFLVETNRQHGGYVALSRCWGSGVPEHAQTKTHNLPAIKAGIEVSSLPKTFADAIHVARSFGI
jgi:hypothetical protein